MFDYAGSYDAPFVVMGGAMFVPVVSFGIEHFYKKVGARTHL